MDCKIGVRTYLEEELLKAKEKQKLRKVSLIDSQWKTRLLIFQVIELTKLVFINI